MSTQQKTDLLLDALSCLDDDILARGLALRSADMGVTDTSAAAGKNKAEKTAAPYAEPPLMEISPTPPPRRPSYARRLAVILAAVLLFTAIPLSVWLVASLAKGGMNTDNAPTGTDAPGSSVVASEHTPGGNGPNDPAEDTLTDKDASQDSTAGILPGEDAPQDPEEPDRPQEGWEGIVSETETPPEPIEPSELVWVTYSNLNGNIHKYAQSDTGKEITLLGKVACPFSSIPATEQFNAQTANEEDEMVLEMLGQWALSGYTFDYSIHFPLFHEAIVAERFTSQVSKYHMTLEEALGRIHRVTGDVIGFDRITFEVTLVYNALLTGDELSNYLEQEARSLPDGMDVRRITAVRKFVVDGTFIIDDRFYFDDWGYGNEFYCYEYDGVWYMDASFMDDDLSMDFALCEIGTGNYYRPKYVTGQITALDDEYLCIDDDLMLNIKDMELPPTLSVGDTVTVTYRGVGIEAMTSREDAPDVFDHRVDLGCLTGIAVEDTIEP